MLVSRPTLLQDTLGLLLGGVFFLLSFQPMILDGLEVWAALVFTLQLGFLILRNMPSWQVAVFLLFCLTYPLVFLLAKYLQVPYHYLLHYQDPKLELILISNGIIFFSLFFWGITSKRSKIPLTLQTTDRSLYWLSLCAAGGFILLGVVAAWPPVLTGYSVESNSSSLFEYAVIPAVICVLVAHTPREKKLLYFLILIGIITPLLFARRGVSIIFFVILFHQVTKKIKNPWLIFASLFAAYLGFRVFALARGDIAFSVAAFFGMHSDAGLSNHQGGVIVSSVTYLGLIDTGLWDIYFRIQSALGLFFAPFLPSSLNPFPQVFLHLEALKVASIPGSGGFPFVFLFVWGGVGYVIIGALAMRWALFNTYINPSLTCAKLIILVSFPRWYAYSLPVGFKYFLMALIISAILMSLRRRSVQDA